MLKSVNSSGTCPCVSRLAGVAGTRHRAAFLHTAPRFPTRIASYNVSPAQFNKLGLAEMVHRRSRMPRMRMGGFLSSAVKETCPLPRDSLRQPGPAHYHVEADKRKRLGEAPTPANAALRARSSRGKALPP
ncbi:uncharacterized protein LOC113202237, partial [Frankliniella occidentalis]|uniref:Uncharacterized protein LOC113202237 n=1 Tax=Frankliniella occidentalis TaxID=133901 RepID=A0A9C6UB22_FRAOC